MATWAVGDIQGCFDTLKRLLDRIEFDPSEDRLWLVGDLVNRGPKSLDVLRWARDAGGAVTSVLGNHDVKLLAQADGLWPSRKGDTLDDVLRAPDRDELLAWLADRPFVHAEGDWLMVHAGLPPTWSAHEALALAEEASAALRGKDRRKLLESLKSDPPLQWDESLTGWRRLAAIVTAVTRLRTCTREGVACEGFSGSPEDAPEGCVPWFDLPRRSHDSRILFGHWAALGLLVRPDVVGLDSGCVWGRYLTAYRLEDGQVEQEAAVEGATRG